MHNILDTKHRKTKEIIKGLNTFNLTWFIRIICNMLEMGKIFVLWNRWLLFYCHCFFYCIVVVSWMCACVLRRGKHAKFLLHKLEDSILHNLDKENVNRWLFSRYNIILLQIKQQLDWTKRYQTIHFKIDICCFLAKIKQ